MPDNGLLALKKLVNTISLSRVNYEERHIIAVLLFYDAGRYASKGKLFHIEGLVVEEISEYYNYNLLS